MRNVLKWIGIFSLAGSAIGGAACKATTSDGGVFQNEGGGGGSWGNGSGNGSGGNGGMSSGEGVGGCFGIGCPSGSGGSSTGTGTTICNTDPNADDDGDGYSESTGDCNDCDVNVNPGAVDVVGDKTDPKYQAADEDCNGTADDPPANCDSGLPLDSTDPADAARAVDLCKNSTGATDWGIVSAKWVMANGNAPTTDPDFHLGHGILSAFGPNVTPRAGQRMFVVSSGAARQPTDAGYKSPSGFDKGYTGGHPQGFPKESPACPNVTTGTPHDSTAVELEIRAPSNAHGFSFDFNFYTYEWPGYICSQYNDFFVAILSPIPMGQSDGQISFDKQGNPISVNNAFMNVCGCSGGPPCTAGGKSFSCPLGTAELTGTGFESHAATSWLSTTAPVQPGQVIRIRWGAYDSGDGILDSTAIVDNWKWSADPGTTVGTEPSPPIPK